MADLPNSQNRQSDEALNFVQWFRDASPYINQHRGKTFVVAFGGAAVEAKGFEQIIQDIALLNSLGIRLILIYGTRPQIDKRLASLEQSDPKDPKTLNFHLGRRVTSKEMLLAAIDAAGASRVTIEAALSMSLINSPMHGAGIRIHSGNLITAKPLGVVEGVDYKHTGVVRKVDQLSIAQQLAYGNIVLISPLGYSPTGEVFNLCYESVASKVAAAVKADKLIYLTSQEGILDQGSVVRDVMPSTLSGFQRPENASLQRLLACAADACQKGVSRVHLLSYKRVGAILLELFTRDGVGTMLCAEGYEEVRYATVDDVAGIITLIRPLEEAGVLVKRSRERLEQEVQQFTVIVRDGSIVAAAALYPEENRDPGETERYAELACFVVHENYRSQKKGDMLLTAIEKRARGLGINRLFVLTTQTAHWFLERGFGEQPVERLPIEKQNTYNYQRRSKVFVKEI